MHYQPIDLEHANPRTRAFINSFNAILANHMWHEMYDDHDGYPGSDLCQENETALHHLAIIIEMNRNKGQESPLPAWVWFLLGVATLYCTLHLAGVSP